MRGWGHGVSWDVIPGFSLLDPLIKNIGKGGGKWQGEIISLKCVYTKRMGPGVVLLGTIFSQARWSRVRQGYSG